MLTLLTALPLGLFLIIMALGVVAIRYAIKARITGNVTPPVTVSPGAAKQLIKAALVGNKEALLMAATDSLHIWITEGSIEQRMLELGFDDVQRRLNDPKGTAPIIRIVAHLLGIPEQQVFDAFKAEAGLPPTPRPVLPALAVPAATALLLLSFASLSFAASPLPAPQRWYPAEAVVVLQSPTFYTAVSAADRANILAPNGELKNDPNSDTVSQQKIYPTNWRQPVSCQREEPLRFWQQTAPRRIVSAPVRFLGRLFGRFRCG